MCVCMFVYISPAGSDNITVDIVVCNADYSPDFATLPTLSCGRRLILATITKMQKQQLHIINE